MDYEIKISKMKLTHILAKLGEALQDNPNNCNDMIIAAYNDILDAQEG